MQSSQTTDWPKLLSWCRGFIVPHLVFSFLKQEMIMALITNGVLGCYNRDSIQEITQLKLAPQGLFEIEL